MYIIIVGESLCHIQLIQNVKYMVIIPEIVNSKVMGLSVMAKLNYRYRFYRHFIYFTFKLGNYFCSQ